MFYVAKDKKIDVAWVYDIDPADGVTIKNDFIFDNCYYPKPSHTTHCTINDKADG